MITILPELPRHKNVRHDIEMVGYERDPCIYWFWTVGPVGSDQGTTQFLPKVSLS